MEKQHDLDEKQQFLWKAAMTYHKSSPTLSRILMSKYLGSRCIKNEDENGESAIEPQAQRTMCWFCGSIWMPGNHTVKLTAKPKVPKKIGSLLRREIECNWKLTSMEKRLIESTKNPRSNLVYHCLRCRNSTKIPLEYPYKIGAPSTPKKNTKKALSKRQKKKHRQSQNLPTKSTPQFESNKKKTKSQKNASHFDQNVRCVTEMKTHVKSEPEKRSFQPTWVQAALERKTTNLQKSRVQDRARTIADINNNKKQASKKATKHVNKLQLLLKQSSANNSFKDRLATLLQRA